MEASVTANVDKLLLKKHCRFDRRATASVEGHSTNDSGPQPLADR
jgi:hypothetical protein